MYSQYGDIILVHGENFFSNIIQNLTGSKFSHAALCAETGKIAEMTRYGFQYQDNHYLSNIRPFVVLRHKCLFPGSNKRELFMRRMKNCIEKFCIEPPMYDFYELLNQALKLILIWGDAFLRDGETFVSQNKLLAATERLICSALVDEVYEKSGLDLFPNKKTKHTTPADIAMLATVKNPSLLEVYRSPNFR